MTDLETIDAIDQGAEAVATPEVEAVETVETPVTETEGQARDERGRFATLEEIATEPVAEGTDAAPTEAATTETTEAVEEPAKAEPTPFAVRALGADYAFDGAVQHEDGSVVFAPEARERLHQLLGRSILINKRAQEVERERSTLRTERAAIEAFHKPLEDDVWGPLKAAQSLEEFQEIAAGLWLNREVIDAKRALAKERAELTVQREPVQPSPDEQRDALEREVDGSIKETFTEVRTAPWAKGLTADDWKEIEADVRETRGSFLVQAADGLYYDGPRATAFVQRQAARITRERERVTATARQAQVAARKNAGATVSAVKAPPGVGTSAPASKPAAAAPQKPAQATVKDRKTEREKFENWILTGKDD